MVSIKYRFWDTEFSEFSLDISHFHTFYSTKRSTVSLGLYCEMSIKHYATLSNFPEITISQFTAKIETAFCPIYKQKKMVTSAYSNEDLTVFRQTKRNRINYVLKRMKKYRLSR